MTQCRQHPNYKGLRKPASCCPACFRVWHEAAHVKVLAGELRANLEAISKLAVLGSSE